MSQPSQLSNLVKINSIRAIAFSFIVLPLIFPTSIHAEAPLGESYSPPQQLPADTYTPTPEANNLDNAPRQGVEDAQAESGTSWGWLGLLGLIGVAGFLRRKPKAVDS